MEKRIRNNPDLLLLSFILLLVFFGVLILASVSASFSMQKTGSTFYYLNHQLLFGLLPGFILGFLAFLIPLEKIRTMVVPLLLLTILFLGAVFLPVIGGFSGGASRWIYLGPLSFQPSELLKLSFILYIAALLSPKNEGSEERNSLRRIRGFSWEKISKGMGTLIPFLFAVGVIAAFLVAQPDVGTLAIIAAVAGVMYFCAKTPFWHILALGGLGILLLFLLIHIAPYRFDRLAVFLNPDLDPLGKGYQLKQAFIGIGSGGLTGRGLGMSVQKFGFLPQPMSDSIFAVFAEETGFLGSILLVVLFLAFAWRSLLLSARVNNQFAGLCMVGITTWITFQALVNIGALSGLLPLTGVPLPFISYGGSALVSELIAMGILLNASRRA